MYKKAVILAISVILFGVINAQKGSKSISAGPLISIPLREQGYRSNLETGVGLEAIGQYNFSDNSSLLLQTTLASWGVKIQSPSNPNNRLTMLSVRGGYKYQFGASGFFVNGLVGTDIELADGFSTISIALGGGKRFILKDDLFIDAGVDLIDGDTEFRGNLKAIFSLAQTSRNK